jgi:alcohol dehydrogenase class IV
LLTAFILPWVMEFNSVGAPEKFARIAVALGEDPSGLPTAEAAGLAVKAVRFLLDDLNISPKLSAHGIPRDEFPAIAKATVGAVRLISNNPRPVTEEDVVKLLEANY